jgi:hypothetical protein
MHARCIARLVSAAALLCALALPGCSTTPQFPGAPPDVVEDCRRQVTVLTEGDPGTPGTEPLAGEADERGGGVIDEARAAREDAEKRNLAAWPEEVLLYRCLAARGVELDDKQQRELAEWEANLDPD